MSKPKRWSRIDEEKRLCMLWLQEPLVNPETGHPIDRNGPTFNMWRERCKNAGIKNRPTPTNTMTWRKCQEWYKNPDINPDSGRKINRNGPTYKWIEQQCKCIEEKELVLEGDYYVPDKKGMVPCVLFRGTLYVVRTFAGRKVWGPLNKPAKGVKLYYYADTWDYHYNHYKPIFIGGAPPPPRRANPKPKPKNKWLNITKTEQPKENPKYVVDNIVDLFIGK